MNADQHIFALYLKTLSFDLSSKTIGDEFSMQDKLLGSRIISVLRLEVGDSVIFFDEEVNVVIKINHINLKKNSVQGVLQAININKITTPVITLYQCVTQKSAFEEIIYTATQMGVIRVVPVISAKVQHKFAYQKDGERLHKMMIAGAEQSKNFVFPVLEDPIKFEDLLEKMFNQKIFFSVTGKPLLRLLNQLAQSKKTESVNVLIGCEGGLTQQEEKRLMEVGWKPYQLTPTILRAVDAVVVGLGSIRSVCS